MVRDANKVGTAANLGFETKLWQAADKLRSNMDAAEYKHVVQGLIFKNTSRIPLKDTTFSYFKTPWQILKTEMNTSL